MDRPVTHLPSLGPLYHYTSIESARQIDYDGYLYPIRTLDPQAIVSMPEAMQPLFDLIWATDLPVPDRDGLGLTSHSIDVDRTTVRYRILNTSLLVPWGRIRRTVDARLRDGLELAAGAMPRHWWASADPSVTRIPVIRDVPGGAR
jgi:hypothetical protein